MLRLRKWTVAGLALLGLAAAATEAQAHWFVGVRVGIPIYPWGCGPYCYPYPVYGGPVYVAPGPVVVQPGVVVQSPPADVQPGPAPAPLPPPRPVPEPPSPGSAAQPPPPPRPVAMQPTSTTIPASANTRQLDIDHYLGALRDPNEAVRADSVTQLGRIKAQRAVDQLAATLAGDRSPTVREAAARSLALIGSPKAMPALRQAALGDPDRDVRHSAQFALEVIQANAGR